MINLYKHTNRYFEELNTSVLNCFQKNGKGETVLDVGCGLGVLGKVLKERGYEVTGIENDKDVSKIAESRLERLIVMDLTDLNTVTYMLNCRKFDYIVLSDVLEHLYDPFKVLLHYLGHLKQNGRIIISVPNVLVWPYRLKMLFGKFEYRDSGVMDRTHIRFFTVKTIKILLRETGCKIIKIDYVPYLTRDLRRPLRNLVGDKNYLAVYNWYLKYIYPIEYVLGYCWKSMFGFRIVLMGKLK